MSGRDYGGLYDTEDARDSCGVGLVVDIGGRRSHSVVEKGLRLIEGMAHRGAENGDGRSGDGAGILVQIPHGFVSSLGIPVPEAGRYGTGLVFLPKDRDQGDALLAVLEGICAEHAVSVIADGSEIACTMVDATEKPRLISLFGYKMDIAPGARSLIFPAKAGRQCIGPIEMEPPGTVVHPVSPHPHPSLRWRADRFERDR